MKTDRKTLASAISKRMEKAAEYPDNVNKAVMILRKNHCSVAAPQEGSTYWRCYFVSKSLDGKLNPLSGSMVTKISKMLTMQLSSENGDAWDIGYDNSKKQWFIDVNE